MEKAFTIQKQIRDNAKTVNNYMTDLQNWEFEMKRKEAALNGQFEQDLPPVRSKIPKEKPVQVKKKEAKRIKASDYQAWDKFDVDKACEEVDMEDKGPVSLDSKKSQADKQEKLREEAQYEKERGNAFVKEKKWKEAIPCYTRAIELVNDDAIYYANRGLCYLKLDSLQQAERDCTEALRLDPTYVKALQRRSAARTALGSLRSAANDLTALLEIEPHNREAKRQLEALKQRMGTKGSKSKSSPASTPTSDNSDKSVESTLSKEELQKRKLIEQWKEGGPEKYTVIKPAKKPPHLRSKRPLKSIPIKEIKLGESPPSEEMPKKIIEIREEMPNGCREPSQDRLQGKLTSPPESRKLGTESVPEKYIQSLVAPTTSVQFMAEWKYLKGNDVARSHYLSLIEPSKLPAIFANALESSVVSDILRVLQEHTHKFTSRVRQYLHGLADVKRFSALAMFLTIPDKLILVKLLDYCRKVEKCSEQEIVELKKKYEL